MTAHLVSTRGNCCWTIITRNLRRLLIAFYISWVQILVGKNNFFPQSHLRAGNGGNEEINKIALSAHTSAFKQEMVTVLCHHLPGVSDINVTLIDMVASNGVVESLPATPKGWAERRDAHQMPEGNILLMMVDRDMGIREHHVNCFLLFFPNVLQKH